MTKDWDGYGTAEAVPFPALRQPKATPTSKSRADSSSALRALSE
jgi:hypothetical protein